MRYPLLTNYSEGVELLPIIKHINQDKINTFGVLTGATGAVHVDPEYCKNSSFKTTLAHGFLTMAYVSEMMEDNFGLEWTHSGEIEVKFTGAARPGDSLIVSGKIKEINDYGDNQRIVCETQIVNQYNKKVLVGTAMLTINSKS